MPLPSDPGQSLVMYSAEPDSPSHAALRRLASWAAQPREQVQAEPPIDA